MDVERLAVFASVGFAIAVAAFVLWGPSPRPRRRGKVIGINNLGFTCFLNSLLQALAACPTFVAWLQAQHQKNGKASFVATLLNVFQKINGYAEDMYGDVTPVEIISSLGSLWSFTPGYQDAHELFHVVLCALQSEVQPVNRTGCLSDALPPTPPDSPEDEGLGDALSLRSSVSCNDIAAADPKGSPPDIAPNGLDRNWNRSCDSRTKSTPSIPNGLGQWRPGLILARSSELLSDKHHPEQNGQVRAWKSAYLEPPRTATVQTEAHPFSGLLTSQLRCSNCRWKSAVRYDRLETVSLALPPVAIRSQPHTLEELLARFVSSEVVRDVLCTACGTRCVATKTLTLGKLPKCLCLHISRTTWSSGLPVKRNDPVKFPLVLVLDPYTYTETKKRCARGDPEAMMLIPNESNLHGRQKYQLRAVVEHRGPVDSGHFVCYRRGNRANQWLYTSDTVVESSTLTEVLCATPYLLFYERING